MYKRCNLCQCQYQYLSLKCQYHYQYLKTVLKYSSSTSTIIQYYNPGARFTKYLTIYHTIIVSLS